MFFLSISVTLTRTHPLSLFIFPGQWLSKMTSDSNAGALDAGLDAVIAFADLAPTADVIKYMAADDCKIFANVVDKAFQGKSSALAK
jgi:hypothetical protein